MSTVLGDKTLIRTIKLRNLLSFGPQTEELELKSLNVLIGPNASGKSNLIEAVGLLRSTPGDLMSPVREGGGVAEWLWKGNKGPANAVINVTVSFPRGKMPLRHKISFTMVGQRFELMDEAIENEDREAAGHDDVRFYYRHLHGHPMLNVRSVVSEAQQGDEKRTLRGLRREDLKPDQSVLSQRKDPDQYPEITYLGNQYSGIRLYREWNLGRYTLPRLPQKPDLPDDFLLEDFSNLGLVLNSLERVRSTWDKILESLRHFNREFSDILVGIHGGTVQVFLHESGLNQPIPATRLSDGTLRYLCLLSILCHPSPPPLICIEEPEIGLHPDALLTVADLLVEASHRTQLIVTTHSDVLVDALTKVPESVVVCEKQEGSTVMRRLNAEDLKEWLGKYTLGQLWREGELGGNRW